MTDLRDLLLAGLVKLVMGAVVFTACVVGWMCVELAKSALAVLS